MLNQVLHHAGALVIVAGLGISFKVVIRIAMIWWFEGEWQ